MNLSGILNRFRHVRITVTPADPEDLAECVLLGMEALDAYNLPVNTCDEERMARHLLSVIENPTGAVFIARDIDDPVGLWCCAVAEPDIWDNLPVANVWFLFVRPEARNSPAVLLALFRAGLESMRGWGTAKMRTILDPNAAQHVEAYKWRFGLSREATCDVFSLDLREVK